MNYNNYTKWKKWNSISNPFGYCSEDIKEFYNCQLKQIGITTKDSLPRACGRNLQNNASTASFISQVAHLR